MLPRRADLHVCDTCHDYAQLQYLMDFNKKVGPGDNLRGGVPDEQGQIYPNKKPLCEYEQCAGAQAISAGPA